LAHENFQSWVALVTMALPQTGWVVVCKNHPLDPDLPRIAGALYVGSETHVNDLLDLADAVLLMNSGVGVIAMAFGKPVICTAEAFYSHPGLAYNANSPDDVLQLLRSEPVIDREKVRRFYWHLLSKVYSFGTAKYRNTRAADGSARTIVQRIIFNKVTLGDSRTMIFGSSPAGLSLDAPLFYSFGSRKGIKQLLSPPTSASLSGPKAGTSAGLKKSPPKSVESNAPSKKVTPSHGLRKLKKLVRNPGMFFRDYAAKRKGRKVWFA
jgi:hypothetical protein